MIYIIIYIYIYIYIFNYIIPKNRFKTQNSEFYVDNPSVILYRYDDTVIEMCRYRVP